MMTGRACAPTQNMRVEPVRLRVLRERRLALIDAKSSAGQIMVSLRTPEISGNRRQRFFAVKLEARCVRNM